MKAELSNNDPSVVLILSIDEAKALYWSINPYEVESQPLTDELKAQFFDDALDVEATIHEALESAGVDVDDDCIEPQPMVIGAVIPIDLPEFFDPRGITAAINEALNRRDD